MLGRKRYSPPRMVTKRGCGLRKNGGLALDRHLAVVPSRLADQEVLVGAEPERVAVVDPERLDRLELAPDVGLEADEDQAAVDAVVLDARPSGSGGP